MEPTRTELQEVFLKIVIAWGGYFAGLSLADLLQLLVLLSTLVFTVANTYVLIRDKILQRGIRIIYKPLPVREQNDEVQ